MRESKRRFSSATSAGAAPRVRSTFRTMVRRDLTLSHIGRKNICRYDAGARSKEVATIKNRDQGSALWCPNAT
jgi:hypothetical protein